MIHATQSISVITTIRKSGHSFIIRVPCDEMDRVGVTPGDYVSVEIRPVEVRPQLTSELHAIAEDVLNHPEAARAIALLADA